MSPSRASLSDEKRNRRLDDAVQRFVGDVVGLCYPADAIVDRVAGELAKCLKQAMKAGSALK